jgi:hypothetical protein
MASAGSAQGLAHVLVTAFDGTRQPIGKEVQLLLTYGRSDQTNPTGRYVNGPVIDLELPFQNGPGDTYSVVLWTNGHKQAGFQPVKIRPDTPQHVDLMLLPTDGGFHFANAKWTDVVAKNSRLSRIFLASVTGDAGTAYEQIMEDHADHLACLLNITTAMQQISLGPLTALDYLKQFDLGDLRPDRFFGYADAGLMAMLREAGPKQFQPQAPADLALHHDPVHGDATASFKQLQFGEANVQLTFHEGNKKTIGGVDCVCIEPDIDYYKDPLAHTFGEVIPNGLSGNVSNPEVVYVLRWIAGRHAGQDFDPLYTIE